MMKWMTLFFPVFLYSMPAGLTIYILTSTSFGIIESKIIRDKLKKLDAAKGTVTIVDADPVPAGGGRRPVGTVSRMEGRGAKGEKRGGVMGWLAEMQSRVEDIKKEQEKRDRNKKK